MQKLLFLAVVGKAAATANWNELKDKTCMLGVAAQLVPGAETVQTSVLESTVEECKAACVKFSGCEAISLNKAAGGKFSCFFRQQVSPDKCVDALGQTTTYVMTSSFEDHTDTDCLLGPAAKTVPGVSEPAEMQTTVAGCEEKCAATTGCEAALVRSGGCYLRQGVSLGKCFTSKGTDLYILRAARKEGALVQAWQMPAEEVSLYVVQRAAPLLGTVGLLLSVIIAVAWRIRQQRIRGLAEHGLTLMSPAEHSGDDI
eukprot:TRINITY_DN40820_c0_g1_i1.p1 TRINITY_DN40820_c0_g1~~TRINITY_DN40820_c0_g1_i1.p1  ORF type:complete len:281 (-),score=56.50 TRINITY_DN40820_c0_g1_i1:242-1012(-)